MVRSISKIYINTVLKLALVPSSYLPSISLKLTYVFLLPCMKLATLNGYKDLVQLLLNNGADPSLMSEVSYMYIAALVQLLEY